MRKGRKPLSWLILLGIGLSGCSINPAALRPATLSDDPVAGQINGAIWSDLEHDIFFNGRSWAGLLRSEAEQELTVDIRNMRCRSTKRSRSCTFDLVRLDASKPAPDVEAPDGLRCSARFVYDDKDRWTLPRLRLRKGGGPTRTSMECDKI